MFMVLFIYGKLTFLFVQKQTFFATQHKILALLATFFLPGYSHKYSHLPRGKALGFTL
jgi:hypothetical protein